MRLLATAALLAAAGCGGSKPDPNATKITIDTAPENGADCMVAGVQHGKTPSEIPGLTPGFVDVILQKDGYRRAVDRVEVVANEHRKYTVNMEPVVGFVSIDSTPDGAEVKLDGESIGVTPVVKRPTALGKHTYTVELANYYPASGEVDVKEDFQYAFPHDLKPMESIVSVVSRPGGAIIWVNNERRKETTPAKLTLNPGTYIIGVRAKGYVQAEEKVVLGPHEEKSIMLKMNPGDVPDGMVLVPAGAFFLGADNRAPDEAPRREVKLESYYIDKYEVTNVQFQKVFASHAFPKGKEEFPVTGISWSQANEYAHSIGKRLPTEAEWEKAARGDDEREYPWGNEFDKENCNSAERDVKQVVKAGSYIGGMSPFGCFEMAGNAYEWTQSWYEAYPGNDQVTKDYGQVYRVLRGGSYDSAKFEVRCARRRFDRMDAKRADYGFRCAKDVAGE